MSDLKTNAGAAFFLLSIPKTRWKKKREKRNGKNLNPARRRLSKMPTRESLRPLTL
jgi:hypothetical protein